MGHSYGTANQAFDPHSELDDISHGSFQVNGATLKVTTSSEEEEEEDSVTPRQEHISRGVLKLGLIHSHILRLVPPNAMKFQGQLNDRPAI